MLPPFTFTLAVFITCGDELSMNRRQIRSGRASLIGASWSFSAW
jgi:hypothetical protein